MLTQLLQPFQQTARLLLNLLNVALVHNLQTLKRVGFVLLPEHRTVRTNGFGASVTEIVQRCIVVLGAKLLFWFDLLRLEGVDGSCYLLYKTAINQLVNPQTSPAMRA